MAPHPGPAGQCRQAGRAGPAHGGHVGRASREAAAANPGIDTAIPVRRSRFEERADGSVTVFVPRFTSGFARRFIMPLFARPEFRVQLDDLGSAVWRACDGRSTVAEIVLGLAARTAADAGELRGRVLQFLGRLAREGSIEYVTKEQT